VNTIEAIAGILSNRKLELAYIPCFVSNVTEFGNISNMGGLEDSGFFKSSEGVISSQVKSKTASSHGYSHFDERREKS